MSEKAIIVTMVPVTPQTGLKDQPYENLTTGSCFTFTKEGQMYMVTDIELKDCRHKLEKLIEDIKKASASLQALDPSFKGVEAILEENKIKGLLRPGQESLSCRCAIRYDGGIAFDQQYILMPEMPHYPNFEGQKSKLFDRWYNELLNMITMFRIPGVALSFPRIGDSQSQRIQVVSGNPVTVDGITVPPGFVCERSPEGGVTITPPAGHTINHTGNPQTKSNDRVAGKEDVITSQSPGWQNQKPLPALRWVERIGISPGLVFPSQVTRVLQQLHEVTGNDGDGMYCRPKWIDVPVEKEEK